MIKKIYKNGKIKLLYLSISENKHILNKTNFTHKKILKKIKNNKL